MARKHWISIIKCVEHTSNDTDSKVDQGPKELYYNLDSKLTKPQLIGSRDDLIDFLQTKNNECEILLVVDSELRNTASGTPWILDHRDAK